MSVEGTLLSFQLCQQGLKQPGGGGRHHCRSLGAGQEIQVPSSADNLPQPLPLPCIFYRGVYRARAPIRDDSEVCVHTSTILYTVVEAMLASGWEDSLAPVRSVLS